MTPPLCLLRAVGSWAHVFHFILACRAAGGGRQRPGAARTADVRFVTPVGLSLHKVVDGGVGGLQVPARIVRRFVCRCQDL